MAELCIAGLRAASALMASLPLLRCSIREISRIAKAVFRRRPSLRGAKRRSNPGGLRSTSPWIASLRSQ
ncbi:hypothetical protein DWE98_13525 [Bosea caraganae]|uniref:Uncharacterized protein n=1 Tax=Bosea caraganae TaxID=2763117 RepID=A0A370L5X4_9HYPH|nr:hypothetical protein DWE98_13525 [Bosea caraganae]